MNDLKNAQLIFSKAIYAIRKNSNLSNEEEKKLIAQEFKSLNIEQYFGSYELFEPLFNKLVDVKQEEEYSQSEWIAILKSIQLASETLPHDFKVCAYNAILDSLVKNNLVTEDIDFVTEIMNYINENKINLADYEFFSSTIKLIINLL